MAFRQALLVDPPPINVPAGMSTARVSRAVKGALIGRGWVPSNEQADDVDATLNGKVYTAKIHVPFDVKQVKISYVDSTNLKYKVKKDGTRLIHANYMNWMRFLTQDIGRNLQLISANCVGIARPDCVVHSGPAPSTKRSHKVKTVNTAVPTFEYFQSLLPEYCTNQRFQ